MANKKWYVREVNSSRHVSEPYIYWMEGGESINTWTAEPFQSESWRTKKEAQRLSLSHFTGAKFMAVRIQMITVSILTLRKY